MTRIPEHDTDLHAHDHPHPHDHDHDHLHDHDSHDDNHHHDHDHPHDHDHNHEHDHGHEHDHDHSHEHGFWSKVAAALHLPGHTHEHGGMRDLATLADNDLAIRTVWQAFLALGITTVLQIFIYVVSGSVALLADTVHNLGDALNSLPLLIAFILAKRPPNRRYTYGYGRAEDAAGVIIVISIAFSAFYILYESIQKFVNPQPIQNGIWVAAASLIGFVGNEIVASLQIRVGRKISSEAMIADGLHARTDGLTSLAVLIAVIGSAAGLHILDPIIGILIGVMIVFITRDATRSIWYRLMDAVDPKLVDQAETTVLKHDEVKSIHKLQMRWIGHRLYTELIVVLDHGLTTTQMEGIVDHLSHELFHALPNLGDVTIGVLPWTKDGPAKFWSESAHHRVPIAGPAQ